jgi:hypothetical protein
MAVPLSISQKNRYSHEKLLMWNDSGSQFVLYMSLSIHHGRPEVELLSGVYVLTDDAVEGGNFGQEVISLSVIV